MSVSADKVDDVDLQCESAATTAPRSAAVARKQALPVTAGPACASDDVHSSRACVRRRLLRHGKQPSEKAGPAHWLLVRSVSRPAGWQLDFAS